MIHVSILECLPLVMYPNVKNSFLHRLKDRQNTFLSRQISFLLLPPLLSGLHRPFTLLMSSRWTLKWPARWTGNETTIWRWRSFFSTATSTLLWCRSRSCERQKRDTPGIQGGEGLLTYYSFHPHHFLHSYFSPSSWNMGISVLHLACE